MTSISAVFPLFNEEDYVLRAHIQIGVDHFPRSRGVSTLSPPALIVKILREMVARRRDVA